MRKPHVCNRCNIELTETNKAAGRRRCKPCEAKRMKEYYAARPDLYNKHKGYVAVNDTKWRAVRNTYILEKLKEANGCMDCGETNLVVLDFDHRDPQSKLFGISNTRSSKYSWDEFVAEIDKCDVVCANCHRVRSAKMFGNWRLDFVDEV